MDDHRPKWRLQADGTGWLVQEGHWEPKKKAYGWKTESRHGTLHQTIKWLFERLMREGYSAKGLEPLIARIEAVEEILVGLAENIETELQAPEA
jgi:hypothetical protein